MRRSHVARRRHDGNDAVDAAAAGARRGYWGPTVLICRVRDYGWSLRGGRCRLFGR